MQIYLIVLYLYLTIFALRFGIIAIIKMLLTIINRLYQASTILWTVYFFNTAVPHKLI